MLLSHIVRLNLVIGHCLWAAWMFKIGERCKWPSYHSSGEVKCVKVPKRPDLAKVHILKLSGKKIKVQDVSKPTGKCNMLSIVWARSSTGMLCKSGRLGTWSLQLTWAPTMLNSKDKDDRFRNLCDFEVQDDQISKCIEFPLINPSYQWCFAICHCRYQWCAQGGKRTIQYECSVWREIHGEQQIQASFRARILTTHLTSGWRFAFSF